MFRNVSKGNYYPYLRLQIVGLLQALPLAGSFAKIAHRAISLRPARCSLLGAGKTLLGPLLIIPSREGPGVGFFKLLGAGCLLLVGSSAFGQTCTITSVHNDVSCYGESTGTINITITGGSEPYAFAWTGPGTFSSTNQNISGLSAGTYTVTVTGAGGSCTGTASVIISQPDHPLTIVTQPSDQTDCYGNTVEFNIAVEFVSGNATYQWQSKPPAGSFSDMTGETSSSLTAHEIGVNGLNTDDTEYRVIVTDDCGSVTSESALLNINSVTGMTGRVNFTICDGEGTSYEVSTDGPVTGYQWSFNDGTGWNAITDGGAYSGTTTQQLTISNATSAETGGYRVSVTYVTLNQPPEYSTCVITTFTRNRNLTVLPPVLPPVVTADQAFCNAGIPEPLTATAAIGGSGPPYSYQWQISTDNEYWSDIAGEQNLNYSPPPLITTTWFRVAVTDEGTLRCGTAYSYPVTITVNPLPVTSAIYHF